MPILIALLSALATAVVSHSVSQRRSAERLAQSIQAETPAGSAIRLTLWDLMNAQRLGVTGGSASKRVDLPGAVADVSIEHESERIDINSASEALLFAALHANGWPQENAHRVYEAANVTPDEAA